MTGAWGLRQQPPARRARRRIHSGAARKAGAVLALVALAHTAAAAQESTVRLDPAQVAQLDALITAEMKRREIPGLSAAVVLDREVVWTKGYGLSDLEHDVPALPQTVYRLASVSKPITATLVMALAEEGKLDLDAPIRRYVSAFPEKQWPVTLRQLLSHLGGVRHYQADEFDSTRHYQSLAEGMDIFKDDPLVHQPGTQFLYSNYGYTLLGLAVEAATGTTYAEALRQRIFEPARMETARVCDVLAIVPDRARGYARIPEGGLRNSALSDASYKAPGAGLCASAVDVARFASALLKGHLLSDAARDRMLRPERTRAGRLLGYGLGWALSEAQGRREAFHTGGQQEVSTLLYLVPRTGLAVALLCNLEGLADTLPDLARRLVQAAGLSEP